MKWISTIDRIGGNRAGYAKGKGKLAPEQAAAYAEPLTTKFRLLDDDGEIYFEGLCGDLNTDADNAFDPLDCLGVDYGCTTLQYLENGEWETL